jgi:hypothetical protein
MKKILAILALTVGSSAFAANYVSVDVDHVSASAGGTNSVAQYVRAGTEVSGIQLGVQSRTARLNGGGVLSSLEVTGGKSLGLVTPFVGVGRDNGTNAYNYGLVGATAGMPVGPGFAMAGVKTRVGSTETNRTKQTVGFATYSVPVAKNVSVNLNLSKSYQDIKENAVGLGLGFSF